MKKKLLCLSLLLVWTLVGTAQEKAKYRISYRLEYLASQKDTVHSTLTWELDLGDSTALFCNTESRCVFAKLDSLNKIHVDLAVGLNYISKLKAMYPNKDHLEIVYNYRSYDKCRVADMMSIDNFRYEDSIPQTHWTLVADEARDVLGMKCKKAVADVRGRHWTVWYSEDVPFRLGPWLLGGLPGLILAAEDSEGVYKFVAVGMENNPAIDVDFHKDKWIKITKKKFMKLRKEFDEDKIGYLLRTQSQKVYKVTDAKGNEIKHSKPQLKNYFER